MEMLLLLLLPLGLLVLLLLLLGKMPSLPIKVATGSTIHIAVSIGPSRSTTLLLMGWYALLGPSATGGGTPCPPPKK